jgi:FkbM family methyltransferase
MQRLVQERRRFVGGEIRGGTRSYTLAADPLHRVALRHKTRDMSIFYELFRTSAEYEPPRGAAVALRQLAGPRILDLGGNIGLFAIDTFRRYEAAHVTSYEPDPLNLPLLRLCADLNPGNVWDIVEACASSSGGAVHLNADNFADSYVSTAGVEVAAVEVLPVLDNFDYVKMDIEGSEWPILTDPRWPDAMATVSVLALEWHARGCPSGDPRALALSAVRAAGFTVDPGQHGWHHGSVWGWR